MNQRGLASILVIGIIVAVIAIGVGGYFYISDQGEKLPEDIANENEEMGTENASVNLEMPAQDDEKAELVTESKPATTPKLPSPPLPTEEAIPTPSITVPKTACGRSFAPKYGSGPFYAGSLFDAHYHMPDIIDISKIDLSTIEGHDDFPMAGHGSGNTDAELDKLLCNFEREKVIGAIGFTMGEEQLLSETISGAKSTKARVGSKVDLFLSPVGFSAATLENIQSANYGLFRGYGELSFGFGGGLKSNQYPDDQGFLDVYKVAGQNNLVVMIHIGAQQQSRIENILQKNPNVKFLFHGPESENFIHNIIQKYSNAYYSIDAMLIRLPGAPGALMYMVNSKDEFKTKFSQNYQTMLANTVNQWKSKIEQYPDKYMWGTDRYGDWTSDEDISAMLEEFGRAFIGKLDSAVQEKFAYKNAERLLGK